MAFSLLLVLEASPVVNQYLTGKVPKEHLFEQRQLLLRDVFDCNNQPEVALIDNFKRLYHCLSRRIHHCHKRHHASLKSIQRDQDKNRTYCTNIIHKGVDTSHKHKTLNIQILHSFIIHIDFLLFDFEWYSKVYHGLSVSEYMRDGGLNTTYYTGRRLPWTMITTSNTAVMTISTYAHLKFRLYCFYSSTKWSWYSNIKGVYSHIVANLTYTLNLLTFQKTDRLFKTCTYHFIQADFKQIYISFGSNVESKARIVIYDGPGSRSRQLLAMEFDKSTGKSNVRTTAFHAYIEMYNLPFEEKEQWSILYSQVDDLSYPDCKVTGKVKTVHSDHKDNIICSIPWIKMSFPSIGYTPYLIQQYIHELTFTAMTGYVTPKCQFGGLYYIPSQDKALCQTGHRIVLENDGTVEFILIVWLSGYSRGYIHMKRMVKGQCLIYNLHNNILDNNNTLLIDTIEFCRKYICPESRSRSLNLMCNIKLNIPNRPVGSARMTIGLAETIDDCVPGTGTNEDTASYTVTTLHYTHSRFGYNEEKHVSNIIKDNSFTHMFQFLVRANVSLPCACLQERGNLRSYMKIYIAMCWFDTFFSARRSFPVETIFSLDHCLNYTTQMEPPSTLIKHENYTNNYSRHHILTSYPEYCPNRCRNNSFDLKIYRKYKDRVDIYSAKIGEKVSIELNYQSFWMKINIPQAPCGIDKCIVFVKVSDEDELSDIDLKQAAARSYRFHTVR